MRRDLYLSVDIEADGPVPGTYSMLSLGACTVGPREADGAFRALGDDDRFYVELRPVGITHDSGALAVSGLDVEELQRTGQEPRAAMEAFGAWVDALAAREGATPVMCAWPLGFDWAFVLDDARAQAAMLRRLIAYYETHQGAAPGR